MVYTPDSFVVDSVCYSGVDIFGHNMGSGNDASVGSVIVPVTPPVTF